MALDLGPGFDLEGFMKDIAQDLRRFGKKDVPGLEAPVERAEDFGLIRLDLPDDGTSRADQQGMATDVAGHLSINVHGRIGDDVAQEFGIDADDRRSAGRASTFISA